MSPMIDRHIAGCLFGMAFGDALGAETEFMAYDDIRTKFPPNGPLELPGNSTGDAAKVTDDTQMALAVGQALMDAPRPFARDSLAEQLTKTFIDWYNDPENNRAPGSTCLNACENLIKGMPWIEANDISSKGCGANMRVQAVGCLSVDETTRAGIAQLQAAITHGHPTALAASDLTAFAIYELRTGTLPRMLVRRIREYARSQRDVYHESWLGDLWKRAYMMRSPEDYISHGWSECMEILERLDNALFVTNYEADPCDFTGKGWVAEEAFGTGLLCFLMYPDDPMRAIQRAAFTSGDSDSIACLTGSFAGAYHGIDRWSYDWTSRIEYREKINTLAETLSAM